ncbi:MAG: 23S rRNA (pseudouridine(1915)-N(3))-methyltransferase RlmH [bacterium]|nr:23S rRNA (pseudouridine(1915)-N(3))-methyltransferase RlmH [bacterium]
MKIRIISVGRTDDAYVRIGAARFLKRIRVYHPLEEVRVKGARAGKSEPTGRLLDREGERILKQVGPGNKFVLLDGEGRGMTSEAFAAFLGEALASGQRRVTFVIGGAEGVSQKVRERADRILSLSQMTLPHELARLVLLEQLYRGLTILKGKRYHR